jgi:maltose O-acetyltransferase
MIERIVRGVRNRLKRANLFVLSSIFRAIDAPTAMAMAQQNQLKRSLGSCGANVLIRQPTIIEVPHRVHIGEEVTFASFVHIWGNAGVHIGARTMIASHVAITTATHDQTAPHMNRTLIEEPVVIENDVWIGAHAIILSGVTVGEHAIVAAGAVVREDVKPYSIVAGIPAREIRLRTPRELESSAPPRRRSKKS